MYVVIFNYNRPLNLPFQTRRCTSFKVEYDVNIWASKKGEAIQLVTSFKKTMCGHGDLWEKAKNFSASYFEESQMLDGAYTQYLDHLITI